MFLNANHIYTLRCKTRANDILCAASTYEEVRAEAIVLCKATNEDVDIFCHGTASVMGNVTTAFVESVSNNDLRECLSQSLH
jgi:hypothetical protein